MQEQSFTLAGDIHSLTVAPDHQLALVEDAQGILSPLDLQSPHARALLPAESLADGLDDGKQLADGVYNAAAPGGILAIDAIALRPLLAVLGRTGSLKCGSSSCVHGMHLVRMRMPSARVLLSTA